MIRYGFGFGSKISLVLFFPLFILQFSPTVFKSEDQKRDISEGSEEEAHQSRWVSAIKHCYSQRQKRTKAKMKVVSDNHQQLEWFSDDIILNILSRIPARSVMRFRCVSKRWYDLTHNPYFIDLHLSYARRHAPSVLVQEEKGYRFEDYSSDLHLYSIDDRCTSTLKAITSIEEHKRRWPTNPCNGLICLTGDTDIIVLNLTTQESVSILKPSHMPNVTWHKVSLAFQPSANKYKLVWINYDVGCDSSGRRSRRFELMTLGSNSWTSIGDVCYGFASYGLCLRGIMYYLVAADDSERLTGIVSLDLDDEKFREVPVPSCPGDEEYEYRGNISSYHLYELDGNLCFTYHRPQQGSSNAYLDIWVLEDPVRGLWIKQFEILLPRIRMEIERCQYLLTVYNGHALLYRDGGLSCWVIDNNSFKLVDYEKIGYGLVCTYTETLVTVKNFPLVYQTAEFCY